MSDIPETTKLPPLTKDEILRGVIFLGSIFLVFLSFSSSNLVYGLSCLFVSLFFLTILFWKGPIATDFAHLVARYSDNLAFYLDKGERYLCNSFNAEKKSEKVLVGVAYNFSLVMFFVVPIDLLFQELTKGENSLLPGVNCLESFLLMILIVNIQIFIMRQSTWKKMEL